MSNKLEREFEGRGVRRGGGLYLDAGAAQALIARAREEKARILGIETFRLMGATVEPLIDHIADYSESPEAWDAAQQFVRERADNGWMFELVLSEERAA